MFLSLQADLSYIRVASTVAGQVAAMFADQVGASGNIDEFCHAFELSVSESFTNSVHYGGPSSHARSITVEFSADDDHLTVMVTDNNEPFDPCPPAPEISSFPEKGYGLFIIRRLMDTVSYSRIDGKNILTMSKQVLKRVPGIQ
jgi:serine/threonine-protein kinase RsbW